MNTTTAGVRVPALCERCGNVRTVSTRYCNIGKTGMSRVRLKCAPCGESTPHGAVTQVPDWRERDNQNNRDAQKLRELVAFIEGRGTLIWWRARPFGGTVEVLRYVEPVCLNGKEGTELIGVNLALPINEKIEALKWAWRALLPQDCWNEAPVLENADDLGPYVGIHRR
jgi:hypothetical protein